jgi:predicted transcriptional regulator
MRMQNTAVRFDPKDVKQLEKLAEEKRLPVSYFIREAVREYLEKHAKGGK